MTVVKGILIAVLFSLLFYFVFRLLYTILCRIEEKSIAKLVAYGIKNRYPIVLTSQNKKAIEQCGVLKDIYTQSKIAPKTIMVLTTSERLYNTVIDSPDPWGIAESFYNEVEYEKHICMSLPKISLLIPKELNFNKGD